ncbi:hypothetical protein VNO78_30718 [Psophocarpus tetragonolobus]|uniref:Uncharacterized protein n=1 Tax=Psophocarpus tetragonolobus TaxID=3891 RepID=A0AAN9RXD1_PSOTE
MMKLKFEKCRKLRGMEQSVSSITPASVNWILSYLLSRNGYDMLLILPHEDEQIWCCLALQGCGWDSRNKIRTMTEGQNGVPYLINVVKVQNILGLVMRLILATGNRVSTGPKTETSWDLGPGT